VTFGGATRDKTVHALLRRRIPASATGRAVQWAGSGSGHQLVASKRLSRLEDGRIFAAIHLPEATRAILVCVG